MENYNLLRAVAGKILNRAILRDDPNHSTDKWVKYYLTSEELCLLDKLNSDDRISNATELYEINVGLVSGENDFFIRRWDEIKEHGIEDEVAPVISRSEQVKGIICFECVDYLPLTPHRNIHLVSVGHQVTFESLQEFLGIEFGSGFCVSL